MGELVTITPTRPGTSAGAYNLQTPAPIRNGPVLPVQIMGYVPMHECGVSDCRVQINSSCCFRNIVFGNVVNGVADINTNYKNDWNKFLVDYQLYGSNPSATATWKLQKCMQTADAIQEGSEYWITVATLANNTYGVYESLNSIPGHKTYTSYWINWGKVLKLRGYGYYRIKLETLYKGQATCLVSDEFWLRQFDCNLATGTVKFESWSTGKKGSATQQGKIFDLCGFNHYDSIRLPGWFGYLKPSEYLEVSLEYQNGKQKQVSNELIRKYTFNSRLWPYEYHRRLSTYLLLADEKLVSDYNINNSDYTINRIPITRKGLYEINFHDKDHNRNPDATCEFSEGVQTIISSLCCSTGRSGVL